MEGHHRGTEDAARCARGGGLLVGGGAGSAGGSGRRSGALGGGRERGRRGGGGHGGGAGGFVRALRSPEVGQDPGHVGLGLLQLSQRRAHLQGPRERQIQLGWGGKMDGEIKREQEGRKVEIK